jgi:hypothetical protein
MPANRQSTPGFFDFMNQPSQRTVAARKSLNLDEAGNPMPVPKTTDSSNVQVKTGYTKPNVQPPLENIPQLSNNNQTTGEPGTNIGEPGTNIGEPGTNIGDPTVVSSGQQNVLNSYRSYTYKFTLAALSTNSVNDPTSYRNSTLDYVIIESGGKGTRGLSASNLTDLIAGFNKLSPGRFDMFIENVEIENIMGFSEASNVSQSTSIKFDVIEPYSINGFMEALHVASKAAGYISYSQASFVLKME